MMHIFQLSDKMYFAVYECRNVWRKH